MRLGQTGAARWLSSRSRTTDSDEEFGQFAGVASFDFFQLGFGDFAFGELPLEATISFGAEIEVRAPFAPGDQDLTVPVCQRCLYFVRSAHRSAIPRRSAPRRVPRPRRPVQAAAAAAGW